MDFARKVSKAWKPIKIHKKVKLGKCYKCLKLAAKLCKLVVKPLFRMFSPAVRRIRHPQQPKQDDLAFMTCIIKVDASKRGWQKRVTTVLRNCKGVRFKMDQTGLVEVSGICDPNRLLTKIGKSNRIELQWFQFGQCSSNLFMPEAKKDPPAQQKPKYNPPYNSFPFFRGYGHNYQPPQLFNPYAPY